MSVRKATLAGDLKLPFELAVSGINGIEVSVVAREEDETIGEGG